MFVKFHLMQLCFIALKCSLVHAYTNMRELISAINVEYKMDHNIYVVENIETENSIEFAQNAANTIFTLPHLSNNSIQPVSEDILSRRVLLILIFHHFHYDNTESTLSMMNCLFKGDTKVISYYGR